MYTVFQKIGGVWKPLQRYQRKESAIAVMRALRDLHRDVIVRDAAGNEVPDGRF